MRNASLGIKRPLGRDSGGRSFTADEAGAMVASAANTPVLGLTDRYLSHGEVGGDVEVWDVLT